MSTSDIVTPKTPMTADYHYREAERLLTAAQDDLGVDTIEEVAVTVARAQVHATLAQADFVAQLVDATRERGVR